MPLAFIHLSDIHFGQETGSKLIVHDDVKERLIDDAANIVRKHVEGRATGLIVTGDIAYAGKQGEYRSAAQWLDRLTAAIGCEITDVQVVPGNHDIDRSAISAGCELMLNEIAAGGEEKLDDFLESEQDREVLYSRFAAYRSFAEGYGCPLDRSGGIASDRRLEIAPGRILRFIGLNSALVCSANDQEGRLLLGARQHVLPREAGEELVVLCHHPLHWLQDSDDTRRYVRSRARVFVYGHEHNPSVEKETVEDKVDLISLSAGAAVPPETDGGYNYTYNLLIFDWDSTADRLKVKIVPRAWSPEGTRFDVDDLHFNEAVLTLWADCPNFRRLEQERRTASPFADSPRLEKDERDLHIEGQHLGDTDGHEPMADSCALTLLRFFRDLLPGQRIAVLVKLGVLPHGGHDSLTHNIERQLVDALVEAGRLTELEVAINEQRTDSRDIPGKEL